RDCVRRAMARAAPALGIGCGCSSTLKSGNEFSARATIPPRSCTSSGRTAREPFMRILWVKMGGLWPSTTGGRVRSLQIVSALSRHHSVTLITTHGPGDDPEGLARQLPDCHRVISIPYDVPKRGS